MGKTPAGSSPAVERRKVKSEAEQKSDASTSKAMQTNEAERPKNKAEHQKKDSGGERPKKSGGTELGKRPSLTHDQILAKRGYTLLSDLGAGSYAKVVKGHSDSHDRNVAIKVIDQGKAHPDFRNKFLPRELKIHNHVKHANIIQVYDLFRIGKRIYLVMELASKGDILDFVRLRGALGENEAKFMFRQLCEAIRFLHQSGVVHRDLKCENILLDHFHNVKITDFGFARTLPSDGSLSQTFCGSAAYAAPEVLRGKPYKADVYDMWSLGVILHILVNGTMPFDDSDLPRLVRAQREQRIRFSQKVRNALSPEVKSLIFHLLNPDPASRYSANDCVASAWLSGVPYYVRDYIPSEKTVREPLASIKLPKVIPDNTRVLRNAPRGPTLLPDYFISSSTRSTRSRFERTTSLTSLNHNSADTRRVVKVMEPPRRLPSTFAAMPSEISYYDTEDNVKRKVKCNALIDN